MSVTIKSHVIFDHAIQQMIDYEGLGDKCEDFIERGHQTGAKLSHLTARMGNNFRSKFSSQRKREWMQSDPRIQLQTKAVQEKCKRVFKRPRSETNEARNKRSRMERRRAFLASF